MLCSAILSVLLTSSDYPVKPVPFSSVKLRDQFWAPRIETNRKVTIPFAFEKCVESGRVDLFIRAAKALRKEEVDRKPPGYPFDDTDVYKVIEGASYALSVTPDPKLDAYVDDLIAKIAAAQEPDGYIYTTRTIDAESPHPWAGKKRWELEQHDSHELYNAGHLIEAAVAHYQATGKRTFLDVAIKCADLLVRTFGPGKEKIWPGHQITEMALVRLYRVTDKREYLDLAKFLLDCRGGSGEYWQAHKPVIEQESAVGHAVRATYMYSGMADVAAMTGDKSYLKAIDTIWSDVVGSKLYITGGIGATGAGEAFGKPYQLPNMSAYCETCAAVGNGYWNYRLFLLHKNAKYLDVFERTLYNGLISGVSVDGKTFFYPNPLESVGQHQRSPWFGVACCPGNITRFLASLPGYFYAQEGSNLFVNLYGEGSADIAMDGGRKVAVHQSTNYPWDGKVDIKFEPSVAGEFTVNLRIPGWAANQPVPSDLYAFSEAVKAPVTIKVNGQELKDVTVKNGFASITRKWAKGDVVALNLPMPVRLISANSKVQADQGRVAVQRGPIVYCLEGVDNGGSVRNVLLPKGSTFQTEYKADLLGGVMLLKSNAKALAMQADGSVKESSREITLIPYCTWANRGRSEMMVWIPNTREFSRPTPLPTIASTSTVRASQGAQGVGAITDLALPGFMGDDSAPFCHWWPKKGTTEWVEMTFKKSEKVSETMVYWFDDTGRGECRVPKSWRILYKDGEDWKPVEMTSAPGIEKDEPNLAKFKAVTTTALRLEITLQEKWSTGVWEWEVR